MYWPIVFKSPISPGNSAIFTSVLESTGMYRAFAVIFLTGIFALHIRHVLILILVLILALHIRGVQEKSEDTEGEEGDKSVTEGEAEEVMSPMTRGRRAERVSQELDVFQLNLLLKSLIFHEDSWPFLKPVTKRVCPDYHTIVLRPMDLEKIKRQLEGRVGCSQKWYTL